MSDLFKAQFNADPAMTAKAHGRANLIGDHTDYNDGFVLPCLLTHQTQVCMSWADDGMITGISEEYGEARRTIESSCDGTWLDFVTGALALLKPFGLDARGIKLAVTSCVPVGAGVSSSAALEIALLRSMIALAGLTDIDAKQLAKIAQRIEHDFIGTQCGIMDQMVISTAEPGQAMLLDCQDLSFEIVDFFQSAVFMIIHSGSQRKLSEALYNTRLSECRNAAASLGIPSLRQADMAGLERLSDASEKMRVRHVISENQRVLDAVAAMKAHDPKSFGLLMRQSHQSLAEDYEVSSPELDQLVDVCQSNKALGARLTGAGFGGCIVALVEPADQEAMMAAVKTHCPQAFLVDVISA